MPKDHASLTQGTQLLPSTKFRPDIQGLRAVAVLLVALNHAGVGFLGGGYVGVDVFFVLSGYLITGVLIGDAAKHRRVSISNFYVRRARRILPAATLTLLVTTVASYSILNVVRAKEALTNIAWAAVFGANIHFSNVGTDYFAQDTPDSPVRHFWSLAVEEQFYIVWPMVAAIVVFGWLLVSKPPSHRHQVTEKDLHRLLMVIALIFVVSLAWSIYQTGTEPTKAYFSTFARGWELALGAGLATIAIRLERLPDHARFAMGWIGLVAIVAAAVLFSDSTPFPGSAALVPTVGAALMIAAGVASTRTRFSAFRLLSVRPMRYIGDVSYAFYLWHWPVLVLALAYHGEKLPLAVNLGLLIAALALSAVTYRFIENPLRRFSTRREAHRERTGKLSPVLWAWVFLPIVIVLSAWTFHDKADTKIETAAFERRAREQTRAAEVRASAQTVKAAKQNQQVRRNAANEAKVVAQDGPLPAVVQAAQAATDGERIPNDISPSPASEDLAKFIAPIRTGCSALDKNSTSQICSFGSGTKSMVLFGDSHAQMWLPGILIVAKNLGYTVRVILKPGCSVPVWGGAKPVPPGCAAWLPWALAKAKALHPDVALIAAHYMTEIPGPNPQAAAIDKAMGKVIPTLRKSAKKVVLLGDVFGQSDSPVDCLLRGKATMATCSTPFDGVRISFYSAVNQRATSLGAGFIDTVGWFCANARCPLVIGNTVAYADSNHVSSTYARALPSRCRRSSRWRCVTPVFDDRITTTPTASTTQGAQQQRIDAYAVAMHVGFSLMTIRPGRIGGAETYVQSLLREFASLPDRVTVLGSRIVSDAYAPFACGSVDVRAIPSYRPGPSGQSRALSLLRAAASPRWLRDEIPQSLNVMHYPVVVPLPRSRLPSIITLQDVQHHDRPEFFSRAERAYRSVAYDRAARRADFVVTGSETAKRRIVEMLGIHPSRVHAFLHGLDHDRYFPGVVTTDEPLLKPLALPARFILYPATLLPHKNHRRLVEALSLQGDRGLSLVLTGETFGRWESLERHTRSLGLSGRVRHLGFVQGELMAALMRRAEALVFPSMYEGFGFPPLEAMACGCPVACSDRGSLAEICGDAAFIVDPEDPVSIADGIGRLLGDDALNARMRERGVRRARAFSWRRSAEAHMGLYRLAAA